VEIGSLIKAFNYSLNLTGKLSLTGEFSGTRIDADDFRRHWQGRLSSRWPIPVPKG
jgi:AsmA protein